MINVRFIHTDTSYPVEFFMMTNHVVRLTGDVPADTSGFILSRIDHDDNWDYSAYTTIYRQGEGFVEFSDDGSVYVEPEPFPEPNPSEPAPTYDARIAALEKRLERYEAVWRRSGEAVV